MKITRLQTTVVDLPFDKTPEAGYPQFRSAGLVLVFLETDQGLIGEGLVFALNGRHLRAIHALLHDYEPFVIGLDPSLSGAFALKTAEANRPIGHGGLAAMACAAFEEALIDLRAKAASLPISHLLGACRSAVPAYHSGGLWVGQTIDGLQQAAQAHLDRGFKAMKMRLRGRVSEDVERVRAVREVIGPTITLMADANQKLTVPAAIQLGRALEPFDLAWFEEPVSALDHVGEAAVTAALDTPVATGESVYTSKGVLALLQHRAADVVMPDLQRMGGPREFMMAAALAESFDTPFSNHLFSEMSLGLLAAVPGATILEFMPWISPIYQEAIEIDAAGCAVVPARIGWGFSFDPNVVRAHAVS